MVLRIQRAGIGISLLILSGCVSYPRPYPWNFPKAREWNQPLETSWVNFVDNWRNLTASRNKIWNPIIREYEPDLVYDASLDRILPPDIEENELYQ